MHSTTPNVKRERQQTDAHAKAVSRIQQILQMGTGGEGGVKREEGGLFGSTGT